MSIKTPQLLSEWQDCEAVILAWPDAQTDWADWLEDVHTTYINLFEALHQCGVVIVLLCRPASVDIARQRIPAHLPVLMINADYNDTWVRDYAFVTVQTAQGPAPVEFVFNGWGNKFNADKDNAINRNVLADLCDLPMNSVEIVAEGGALEINDQGDLLSTELCLTNPERNGAMSLPTYRSIFADVLGASSFTAFKQGHLEGDDTDGHIDTLVRFAPDGGLVVQGCRNRPDDIHFKGLEALVGECANAFPEAKLTTLPLCEIYNSQGERLPASYANYLICNAQILAPVYGEPEDTKALACLQQAYPNFAIVAVNCRSLVNQFGSLHCITMQVPVGTFKPNILSLASEGVFHYAPR